MICTNFLCWQAISIFCQAKATINRSTRKSDIKTRNKRRMNEIRNRYWEKDEQASKSCISWKTDF